MFAIQNIYPTRRKTPSGRHGDIRRSLTGIFAFFSLEYADFRCTAEELQSERHHNYPHSSLETRETHPTTYVADMNTYAYLSSLLETPFSLLTSEDMASFGG